MAATRKPLPSNPVTAAVAGSLARHVPAQARLALGLSGGVDSVVLLHALLAVRAQHPFHLQAVHVHHGLSPQADHWAGFCDRLCGAQGVALSIRHVRVGRDDPAGVEAAARRARQQIFASIDADYLVTAHQQDDQAETLVLQLLRGAGPKGLAAMAELQRRPGWRAAQLRPLLDVPRAAIRTYAQAQGLDWVDDESNDDIRYRRNALRHQVMPRLARLFPGSSATLARAAAMQAEAAGLLDELAQLDAAGAIAGERLDCAVLGRLSLPRARNLLRHFIERQGQAMPSARRLGEAVRQLRDAQGDARVRVALGEMEVWRFRGGAYLVPRAPAPAAPVRWRGEEALWVPAAGARVRLEPAQGAGLKRSALVAGEVLLGVRQGGERMRVRAGGPHRSLKNLLQEQGVPPWQRDRLPVLWCDGRLAWAEGIGFDADLCAVPGEPGIVPRVEAQAASGSE